MRRLFPAATALMCALILTSCVDDTPIAPEPAPPDAPAGVDPALMAQATQAAEEEIVPNQFIVIFHDRETNPRGRANGLAAQHGFQVLQNYSHAIKGFAMRVPEQARDQVVQALQRNPQIAFVEPDRVWHVDSHYSGVGFTPVELPGMPPKLKAPTTLTAAPLGTFIQVVWLDTNDNQTGHELYRSIEGGSEEHIADTPPIYSLYQDTDVPPGAEACYRARAYTARTNRKGRERRTRSPFSNSECAIMPGGSTPQPPATPAGVSVTGTTTSSITIGWDDVSGETQYKIERCPASGGSCTGGFAQVNTTGADVLTFTDSPLPDDTEYGYRVIANNSGGDSEASTPAAFGNTDASVSTPVPGKPEGLSVTGQTSSSIGLSWTDNTDETGYSVERCEGNSSSCADADFTEVGTTTANTTTYTSLGLSASTTYGHRVVATNGTGPSVPSDAIYHTTDVAPSAGSCDDAGGHDDVTVAGMWGIQKVKAHLNTKWLGAKNGGDCAMNAWFYGIDTGVDSDHPDLNVYEVKSFIGGSGEDDHGHGTHTAGTAAAVDGNGNVVGVAPGALIHGFKVCDAGGSCNSSAIIAAVDEVTNRKNSNSNRPMVANMSLGGGVSAALDQAIRASVNAGVVYAVAAGNGLIGSCLIPWNSQSTSPGGVGDDDINAAGGSNGNTAQINGVITTTSSNQNDSDANCNYGTPVTVAAPGVNITSTYLDGQYAYTSGTSMATPHAAGAALLYLHDHPDASPAEVEGAIVAELDSWSTDNLPNASGRLDVEGL